jgi:uncharacterized protein YpiB (UPF0302 family)
MENKRPYTEMMKSNGTPHSRENMMDVYIDMLLNEILLNKEKKQLLEEIDKALDARDRESFLKLSAKLIELEKRFGK